MLEPCYQKPLLADLGGVQFPKLDPLSSAPSSNSHSMLGIDNPFSKAAVCQTFPAVEGGFQDGGMSFRLHAN